MLSNFGLYPVITEEFCDGRSPVFILEETARAGVRIVQLREKNKNRKELISLALNFRKITKENNILLIINDDLDLALEINADGVHLGQDDMNCLEAKKIAPKLLIGVSTHCKTEIDKAIEEGADYINIGPIFATATKKDLKDAPLGLDIFTKEILELKIPFSVMGGIKKDNIESLLKAGVKNIALITEITKAPDVYKRTKELIDIINSYK